MSPWSKIAALFVLTGALGSGVGLAQPEQAADRAEAAVTEYRSLSFLQSGGFIGVHHQIDVEFATKKIQMRARHDAPFQEATLTDAELALIKGAVTAANLPGARGPYLCRFCADQFRYEITLVTATGRKEVLWEDDSKAPRTLFDLGTVLRRVADLHFSLQ
jgi:hypothetical protein